MDSRQWHTLPSNLVEACRWFADRICSNYEDGGSPSSRAVSMLGAEANANLQAIARAAECIFCLAVDLNPWQALNWNADAPDRGYDVQVRRYRVDIKQTKDGNQYLIWPARKASFLATKPIDILALVKTDGIERGYVGGWITKAQFMDICETAEPGHTKFVPGTLFVHDSKLQSFNFRKAATHGAQESKNAAIPQSQSEYDEGENQTQDDDQGRGASL